MEVFFAILSGSRILSSLRLYLFFLPVTSGNVSVVCNSLLSRMVASYSSAYFATLYFSSVNQAIMIMKWQDRAHQKRSRLMNKEEVVT